MSSTPNENRDVKCPSARRFHIVREDKGAPSEGATYGWMVAVKAVGCSRMFLMICGGHHEPGLHVNDIYRIHWSQNLLTTQSQLTN
ncbi:uncharacterized protein TNCV_4902071 [Trichonephila clavipes]|nr:uncharacterized protein TNCV_4902071 [Trichonephila clavipes]